MKTRGVVWATRPLITQDTNETTTIVEHTHPVGTQDPMGTTTVFGGTHFQAEPSQPDLDGAKGHGNITYVEASAANKQVYIYNSQGVQAQVPLSAFPREEKK